MSSTGRHAVRTPGYRRPTCSRVLVGAWPCRRPLAHAAGRQHGRHGGAGRGAKAAARAGRGLGGGRHPAAKAGITLAACTPARRSVHRWERVSPCRRGLHARQLQHKCKPGVAQSTLELVCAQAAAAHLWQPLATPPHPAVPLPAAAARQACPCRAPSCPGSVQGRLPASNQGVWSVLWD